MSVVRSIARKILPKSARKSLGDRFRAVRPQTVAEGWDAYAKSTDGSAKDVGDLWNKPERLGTEGVSTEDYLPHLDEKIFRPFFGDSCGAMVEIGPGGGRFTALLIDRCELIYAADTSKAMLKHLKNRLGGDQRLRPILLDGTGLPQIADQTLDSAFSWGVFVHLQHWDIHNYLMELKRTLKPGGKALIQHANMASDEGWAKFMRDLPTSLNRHKRPGSFSVMTPELMRIFVERAELQLHDQITDVVLRDCVTLIKAP